MSDVAKWGWMRMYFIRTEVVGRLTGRLTTNWPAWQRKRDRRVKLEQVWIRLTSDLRDSSFLSSLTNASPPSSSSRNVSKFGSRKSGNIILRAHTSVSHFTLSTSRFTFQSQCTWSSSRAVYPWRCIRSPFWTSSWLISGLFLLHCLLVLLFWSSAVGYIP